MFHFKNETSFPSLFPEAMLMQWTLWTWNVLQRKNNTRVLTLELECSARYTASYVLLNWCLIM